MGVEIQPITNDNLLEVGRFLTAYFPPDTKGDEWGKEWLKTVNLPGSDAPNHGFLLRDVRQNLVVGALTAIYSVRDIPYPLATERQHFCNLAVWCVAPDYRLYSIKMLQIILAQNGYTFTDLIPGAVAQKIDQRFGFKYFDTTTYLIPNILYPKPSITITSDLEVIESHLKGDEPFYTYFKDHLPAKWTNHLLLLTPKNDYCYLQWRKQKHARHKFISLRYISHPLVLWREYHALGHHFLTKHYSPFTLAEIRLTRYRIQPSIQFPRPVKRLYKSDLPPDYIDYLYSEITSAP